MPASPDATRHRDRSPPRLPRHRCGESLRHSPHDLHVLLRHRPGSISRDGTGHPFTPSIFRDLDPEAGGEVRQTAHRAPARRGRRGAALDATPHRRAPAQLFRSKRGLPIRSRSAHYWSWNPVRAAFWATLPEHRRRAIGDLEWPSLRHFCGWYFYVNLGFTDELTRLPARARRREAGPRPVRARPRRRSRAAEARRSGRGAADPCRIAATCGGGVRMISGVHPLL